MRGQAICGIYVFVYVYYVVYRAEVGRSSSYFEVEINKDNALMTETQFLVFFCLFFHIYFFVNFEFRRHRVAELQVGSFVF